MLTQIDPAALQTLQLEVSYNSIRDAGAKALCAMRQGCLHVPVCGLFDGSGLTCGTKFVVRVLVFTKYT